jgi:hypothetical protein
VTAPTFTSSSKRDRIEADLVATLENDIDNTSATASTTVDVESASGQAVLKVTATTNFVANKSVMIDAGESGEEVHSVASISAGDSLTLATNLANTQAVGVAVKQDWYNFDMKHVDTVDDAMWLGPPAGSQWPVCKIYLGPETIIEHLTGYDHVQFTAHIVGWMQRQYQQGTRQTSDQVYMMLFADIEKAIAADWTLGGNCSYAELGTHQRVTDDEYPKDIGAPPEEPGEHHDPNLVGVYVPLDIQYMRKRGDAYA